MQPSAVHPTPPSREAGQGLQGSCCGLGEAECGLRLSMRHGSCARKAAAWRLVVDMPWVRRRPGEAAAPPDQQGPARVTVSCCNTN
ncbi:hypothetical protein NDU88_003732 [Pleurodeles waltl]|uniref:Uncharacterized protein n=1 Tax=Pleurodeles waltl TaxID=8319 RepID=A0AAV7QDZ8_PLEWA|nr:hypothetical protein NDU88_003732 [Pleurodeles waltl]